jgi:DNA polymerase-4
MLILHVDMDAFYASVEQRDAPALRGKPVLVGGGKGGEGKRGVVTAASYESRRFGCRSAMPMAQARALCPQAIVVPVRMGVYATESRRIHAIFDRFTPDVQPISIDEAFLDLTRVGKFATGGLEGAKAAGEEIRAAVRAETGLTCSVGVSFNKFLAKLASDACKPDGIMVIAPEDVERVLPGRAVSEIFGIGEVAAAKLAKLGIRTIADLRAADVTLLRRTFGDAADAWLRLAYGLDDRAVHARAQAKSVGKERTFSDDIGDAATLRAILLQLLESAAMNLREDGLRCRRVTVKLRTPDFRTFTRSQSLDAPTDHTDTLWPIAMGLLDAFLAEHRPKLRLLGVTLHELGTEAQPGLFDSVEPATKSPSLPQRPQRSEKIDGVSDAIARKFGKAAITRARTLGAPRRSTEGDEDVRASRAKDEDA